MIRAIATPLSNTDSVREVDELEVRYEGFVISETLEQLLNRSKGEIMAQYHNHTVIRLNNGTILLNEDVPDWEPAHITRLLDIKQDYVEIHTVKWCSTDGCTYQGTLFVFESERFSDLDRVFVEYLN